MYRSIGSVAFSAALWLGVSGAALAQTTDWAMHLSSAIANAGTRGGMAADSAGTSGTRRLGNTAHQAQNEPVSSSRNGDRDNSYGRGGYGGYAYGVSPGPEGFSGSSRDPAEFRNDDGRDWDRRDRGHEFEWRGEGWDHHGHDHDGFSHEGRRDWGFGGDRD